MPAFRGQIVPMTDASHRDLRRAVKDLGRGMISDGQATTGSPPRSDSTAPQERAAAGRPRRRDRRSAS